VSEQYEGQPEEEFVDFGPNRERILGLLHRISVLTPADMKALASNSAKIKASEQAKAAIEAAFRVAHATRPVALSEIETIIPSTVEGTIRGFVTRNLRHQLWDLAQGAQKGEGEDWEKLARFAAAGRDGLNKVYDDHSENTIFAGINAAVGLLCEDHLDQGVFALLVLPASPLIPWLKERKPQMPEPGGLQELLAAVAQLTDRGVLAVAEIQGALQELGFPALTASVEMAMSCMFGFGRSETWSSAGESSRQALDAALNEMKEGGELSPFDLEMAEGAVSNAFLALITKDVISSEDYVNLTTALGSVVPMLRKS
jgi:hypothetical protein